MASTLTIRLSDEDREVLAAWAEDHESGVSTLVRELAEREARRLRKLRTRDQVREFSAAVADDPAFAAEIDAVTVDTPDWPA